MVVVEGPMDPKYRDMVLAALIAGSPVLSEAFRIEGLEFGPHKFDFYEPFDPQMPIDAQLDEIIVGWARQIGKLLVGADTKQGDRFDGYVVQLLGAPGFERVVYLVNGELVVDPIALQSLEFDLRPIWMEVDRSSTRPMLVLRTQLAIAI